MIKVIIIGGVRDFHAMDWYHVLTDIQGINSTLFVTDSISSEGLHDMSRSDDNIEKLFIVDRFLFSSQTRFANYWRNFIKLLVLPIQVYMLKSIKKKNPNAVFHAHPMYYLFIAWISRIQCGVTPQGSEILVRPDRSLMYKFFTVRCLRYASFVTVDSISMKNKIFELSGVTASVVQNGIDTTAILNSSNSVTSRDKISSIRGMAPLYNIDKILATRNLTSPDLGINFIFPFIASDYYDSIKGRKRVKKLEKEIPEGLELTAIFNLSSETLAVINGEVLKKGDYITDKKVVEVLSEQVTLEDDFKQYILEMKNPASQQYGTFDDTLLKLLIPPHFWNNPNF